MTKDQEIKQEMRLYEIYSTAALTGFIATSAFNGFDDLANSVDEIAKEMITKHSEYLNFLEKIL